MYWAGRRIRHDPYHGLAYDLIRRQIHTGSLAPNEQLPAERKLADNLGISRATLRDALKRLEHDGYVVSARGAKGGNFVADEAVINSIARRFLLTRPDQTWRSFEYLSAILTEATKLAAVRRTPSDLHQMTMSTALVRSAQSSAEFRQGQCEFIVSVCRASLNSFFFEGAEAALEGLFHPLPLQTPNNLAAERSASLQRILRAITDSDATTAATTTAELLEQIAQSILTEMRRAAA